MGAMASQITSLMIVYSTVYSGADQRKHQSSASLAFVRGIHRWPVNSLHKWPVMQKMFPFDEVIMEMLLNPLTTFYFLILFPLTVIFLYETGLKQWLYSQCCRYWWPGAIAPGHQQLHSCVWINLSPGGWFNIKKSSYQYRKSQCGDKTILRPSYLHNGIFYTGKMTSLYGIGAQVLMGYLYW